MFIRVTTLRDGKRKALKVHVCFTEQDTWRVPIHRTECCILLI